MTRYFFHIHQDADVTDDYGVELVDEAMARLHGVAMLGQILREDPRTLSASDALRVTATRDDGVVLFTIETMVERA